MSADPWDRQQLESAPAMTPTLAARLARLLIPGNGEDGLPMESPPSMSGRQAAASPTRTAPWPLATVRRDRAADRPRRLGAGRHQDSGRVGGQRRGGTSRSHGGSRGPSDARGGIRGARRPHGRPRRGTPVCEHVVQATAAAVGYVTRGEGGRYDRARDAIWELLRLEDEGHTGADWGIDLLRTTYVSATPTTGEPPGSAPIRRVRPGRSRRSQQGRAAPDAGHLQDDVRAGAGHCFTAAGRRP